MDLRQIKQVVSLIRDKKNLSVDKIIKTGRNSGPLSYAQKRVLFLHHFYPLYHAPSVIHMKTQFEFDIPLLEQAFNILIQKYEILRTIFDIETGTQIVLPYKKINLSYINLMKREDRYEVAKKLIIEHNNIVFNLEEGPLLRLKLIQLDKKEYLFDIVMHHIISDGWANSIMFHELASVYRTLSCGKHIVLSFPDFQYLDYAIWEHNFFQQETNYAHMLAYWETKLGKNFSPTQLTYDYKTLNKIGNVGSIEFIKIKKDAIEKLKKFCASEQITLYELTLTTFFILLYIYTNQSELSIGTALANREKMEWQNMLGLFTNTALLNIKIEDHMYVQQLLKAVSTTNRETIFNQSLPFDFIVKLINPERLEGKVAIIPIFFSYLNFPKMFEYAELKASPFKVDYGVTNFDFELIIEETGDELYITANYYKEVYDKKNIENLLSLYGQLLTDLQNQLKTVISTLVPVQNISTTHKPIANYTNFILLFENQVVKAPKNIAIAFDAITLSYAELNEQANALAHYLQKSGIKIEDRVGLFMHNSHYAIISILAILKCGAVYVPMDIHIPDERRHFIIKDADLSLLLTDKNVTETYAINVVHHWKDILHMSKENLEMVISPGHLAYIMYTSGSTGTPKGVCIENKQLASFIDGIKPEVLLPEVNTFALIGSLATDIVHTTIFVPLSQGKKIIVIPSAAIYDLNQLALLVKSNPIDCMNVTPTYITMFIESGYIEDILPKKLLLLIGEIVKWELIEEIQKVSNCIIKNLYGPTEATVASTVYTIGDTIDQTLSVPIGKPIHTATAYVMNKEHKQVGDGIIGELYIGGTIVARGYLHADKFINEKFIYHNNERLYKTGDLVRRRSDGNIEFLGRKDRQVKISGNRIELDEVEIQLSKYTLVKQCAVLLTTYGLTAYVLLKENATTTPKKIKRFLEKKVPTYMIPVRIDILQLLPVTQSGKIDYKQLIQSTKDRFETKGTKIAPRNKMELLLTQIWEEVLELKSIALKANFFDLGGHSILAVKLIRSIENRLKKKIPLSILFKNNTIEKLSLAISKLHTNISDDACIVEFTSLKKKEAQIYLIHPSGGNVFCYYALASYLKDDFDVYGVQFPFDHVEARSIGKEIKTMSDLYVKKILQHHNQHTPIILGGWSMGAAVAYEIACNMIASNQFTHLPSLIILDYEISNKTDANLAVDDLENILNLVNRIETLTNTKSNISRHTLMYKTVPDITKIVMNYMKDIGQLSPDVQIKDFHYFLEIQKLHTAASENYIPSSAFQREAIVLRAKERASLGKHFHNDTFLGWSKYLDKVTLELVPGNHVTMMNKKNTKFIADAIQQWAKRHLICLKQ